MFPEGFLTSATLGRAIRVVGLLLACSVFAIGVSPSASADTVYTYTGHPFDFFFGVDTCPPVCSISGSFTIPNPLPINFGLSFITPIQFSFTDGSITINQSTMPLDVSQFAMETDSKGNITHWIVNLSSIELIGALDTVNVIQTPEPPVVVDSSSPPAGIMGSAEVTFDSGTWSSSTVPEPSSLLLLGTGLMGVIGAWCRQRLL